MKATATGTTNPFKDDYLENCIGIQIYHSASKNSNEKTRSMHNNPFTQEHCVHQVSRNTAPTLHLTFHATAAAGVQPCLAIHISLAKAGQATRCLPGPARVPLVQ